MDERDLLVERLTKDDEELIHPFVLLCRLVLKCWNGNKHGSLGWYFNRDAQLLYASNANPAFAVGVYKGGDYHGHNIAAIAVDAETKKVLAHAFNCIVRFGSSTEHAEERLIDGLFKSIHRTFGARQLPPRTWVFSTLEPCHQCAGKLFLAGVERVLYLQEDGFIHGSLEAMTSFNLKVNMTFKPMSFSTWRNGLDVPENTDLDHAFNLWKAAIPVNGHVWRPTVGHTVWPQAVNAPYPEHDPDATPKSADKPSVTEFLCSDRAYQTFQSILHYWTGRYRGDESDWATECLKYWKRLESLDDDVIWRGHNYH